MGNQSTKLDGSQQTILDRRSSEIVFKNKDGKSRRSFSAPDIRAATKQRRILNAPLAFMRLNSTNAPLPSAPRASYSSFQQSVRLQKSFSSQSSDMNNSVAGTDLRSMSSTDSLRQGENTEVHVSRRSSRRISWRTWQRDANQGPSTRLLEGRTHVRIGSSCALLPSDLLETDSMDRFHYIVKHVLDRNYHGDLPCQLHRILDIGSGSGIWIQEMSMEFPDSEVIGCDIVDLTGGDALPKNCRWVEGNVLYGLPFDDNQFDMVHQRQLGFYLPAKRLSRVMQELHRVCSPGGQLNLVEMGIHWEPVGHNVAELQRLLRSGLSTAGVDPNAIEQMEPRLRQAGFVDVEVKQTAVPIGAWGGLVGRTLADATRHMAESARPVLVRHCKLRSHEIDRIINDALAEMEINQCYAVLYFYQARKPMSNSPQISFITPPATPSSSNFRWSLASFGRNSGFNSESINSGVNNDDNNHSWTSRRFSMPSEHN